MNDSQNIIADLSTLKAENDSLKHRMDDVECEVKAIHSLSISVSKMAVSIENMIHEIRNQGERLGNLEKVPAETTKMIRQAIITTIGGGVLGAVVTKVLSLF